MTLTNFQSMLHQLYLGDTDSPTSTDEDWTVRLKFLEVAINIWAHERGVLWRELWDTATGTTSGATAALPSDFIFPGGFVRVKEDGTNWTYYKIVDQPKSELFKNVNLTDKVAWITGNKSDGFTLNFSQAPTAGVTWEMPYYRDPAIPTTGADIIEMSDPMFGIYFVLSKLHEIDGEGDRASLAFSIANEKLGAMKLQNAKAPSYQENYVPDQDFELGGGAWGE